MTIESTQTPAPPAASAPPEPGPAKAPPQPQPLPAVPAQAPIAQPVTYNLVVADGSLAAPGPKKADGPSVDSLQAELAAMKAEREMEKLESAVMPKIDPKHAKAAKALLAALPANGGLKARTTAALKYFGEEFKEWMVPESDAVQTGTAQPAKPAQSGAPQRSVVDSPSAPAQASQTPKPGPLVNRRGVTLF